jgi:hypothetical protein
MKLGSHISCSQECRKMWGMNPHTAKWIPTLELQRAIAVVKIHWIEEFLISLESSWNVDVWNGLTLFIWILKNISYGQKNGQKSNYQFDSWPLKVGNHLNSFTCRWCATYLLKALNEGYNFALELILIRGLQEKLWASKIAEVPILGISGLPTWESWDKMTFECWPHDQT